MEIELLLGGCFLPILEIRFVSQTVFPQTHKSYCVVGAYFGFGLNLVGVELGLIELDKNHVGREPHRQI